ncbi:ATP-dependent DNA helicase [bacterium]|nr:ATP-dependent DNA helicase [bacterium]
MLHSHQKILQETFGLNQFRLGQKEIIEDVLKSEDVMAVLPTGGGKSLCYQMAAVAKNELVIVVSPLIALMKDQVAGLHKRGIPAGALYSGQTMDEKRKVFEDISRGGKFLLYLSPERTQKDAFKNWIKPRKIALFAIDEAHCVSQWGHDFREEYAQLGMLKDIRPDVPVLALTASATPLVLGDIAKHLKLKNAKKHIHGFYRKNLYYQVEMCTNTHEKMAFVKQALAQNPTGRVIIYCGTRKVTEEVASELSRGFTGVSYYHAGIGNEERHTVQDDYAQGNSRILVATNAFGMGIDHPDVRLVIHFNMPANIDSLYQEMGRAGRDGHPSTCILLFEKRDKGLQAYFIQSSDAPAEIKNSRWNTLNALLDYADSGECRHGEILTYYRDAQRIKSCGHCDVCDPASSRKIAKPVFEAKNETRASVKTKKSRTSVTDGPLTNLEELRFQLLREWRKKMADDLDVPAFVVFSDRTLKDVAKLNPHNLTSLEKVHGFGKVKIDRFGREILGVLGQ